MDTITNTIYLTTICNFGKLIHFKVLWEVKATFSKSPPRAPVGSGFCTDPHPWKCQKFSEGRICKELLWLVLCPSCKLGFGILLAWRKFTRNEELYAPLQLVMTPIESAFIVCKPIENIRVWFGYHEITFSSVWNLVYVLYF